MNVNSFTISELAERIDAELVGAGSVSIAGVSALDLAGADEVTFAAEKYYSKIASTAAAAVIVGSRVENIDKPLLVVKNVDAAVIAALKIFAPKLTAPAAGIHSTAVVEDSADIASTASIGAHVYIGAGVQIGDETVIGPGCCIEEGSRIGKASRLYANVSVYNNCIIGDSCVIQPNTTIGSIGFGYSFIDGVHELFPHNGAVVIEDCVDIGANCCIDRAKFGNTLIGAGTKTDNLIQIGHGVTIGKCCLIVSQVAVGGSCRIGNGVILAGQAGLRDNIKIGSGTQVGAQAGVINDIGPDLQVLGSPAIDAREKLRQIMATTKLPKTIKQIKELTKKIEKLEAAKDNK